MRRRIEMLCVLLWSLALASAAWPGTSVAVAPFERQGPEGSVLFDVAPRLAQRLGAAGLDRVVGPAEWKGRRTASPTPDELERWGQEAGVEHLLAGSVTRFGTSLSVDARLFDTLTATQVGEPIVAEIANPDELGRTLDAVAARVTGLLRGERVATPPPVGAGAPAAAERDPQPGRGSDEPIEITSDGLSFEPSAGGGRQMDFEGNVKIVKGPLVVTSRVARAIYPPASSSPDEIAARGDVVIRQEGRTARCQRADFDQVRNVMVCTGEPAILEQGCDRVRGQKITFSLSSEELNVEGNVEVKRKPGCEDPA